MFAGTEAATIDQGGGLVAAASADPTHTDDTAMTRAIAANRLIVARLLQVLGARP